MIELPTLYLRDAMDRIICWRTWAENDISCFQHGTVDGKLITHRDRQGGTNEGRANARTPEEQAAFRCQSAWNKKKKAGYTENIEEARLQIPLLPMKAHPIRSTILKESGERKEIVRTPEYPATVQRKLNGLRCLAEVHDDGTVTLRSSLGTQWELLTHIEQAVAAFAAPGDILDGEIYLHGTPLQRINGWIKNGTDADVALLRSALQYHVYDLPKCSGGWEHGGKWPERAERLQQMFMAAPSSTNNVICPVEGQVVYSREEVDRFGALVVSEGYEGLIIRQHDWDYRFGKRVDAMLKWKEFITCDFKILDVLPREHFDVLTGHPVTLCDKFECRNLMGDRTFEVCPVGSIETKIQYWEDRELLIGERLTVRFLEWSEGNVPQGNPVGLAVRLSDDFDGTTDQDDEDGEDEEENYDE